MKKWKAPTFGFFIIICLLLNVGGRELAEAWNLPLWLDSLGTAACAYLFGPVCGAITGITGNLLYGMAHRIPPYYAVASLAMGVVVGFAGRKKALKSLYGALVTTGLVILTATLVSVPLNVIFYQGQTGSSWGNYVIAYAQILGFPELAAQAIGQFYVEFLDKLLTILLLFFAIKLVRIFQGKKKKDLPSAPTLNDVETERDLTVRIVSLLAAALLSGSAMLPGGSRAELPEADTIDYGNYVQTVFNSKNGLPCGEANDIAQTNDGILWIGTYAGLYRYNGREFRWMNGFDSVRNVNCLFVDTENRLWIGSNDNGLSICINEKIANVVDADSGLPSNSVRSIIQASDGYYYIGTTSSLSVLQLNSGLQQVGVLEEARCMESLAADQAGNVVGAAMDGRLLLMREGRILQIITPKEQEDIFTCCGFDRSGRLLAGTSGNEIRVYDIADGSFRELKTLTCPGLKNLKDLYLFDNGQVFITSDMGVGFLDGQEVFHPVNTHDFNVSIDNMLLDYQGNLWFTSSRLGLLRMAPSAFLDIYATVGMERKVVNTVVRWQDAYYFGTDNGLDIVDLDCRNLLYSDLTERLKGSRIRCMMVDSSDHLWICSYGGGLIEVMPDGKRFMYNQSNGSFGNRARLVTELSDGTIMACGDTGISWIRDHEVIHTLRPAEGQINSMILTATELSDGRILAGTDGDGLALLENGAVVRMLTRKDGLSSEVILRTIKDPKAEAVFIVTSNGLCYMDTDGSVRKLDNFPYFNNYNIHFRDDDTMFVMSSAGIYVLNRDELLSGTANPSYELLDTRTGLSGSLTANSWTWSEPDGDLFLPCDIGAFVLNTWSYNSISFSYRMMIASLTFDNEPAILERDASLVVPRDVAKVEIRPDILNYTIQNPTVGYFLEGFDKGWRTMPMSDLNSIVYTNLAPGTYIFRLGVFDSRDQLLTERSTLLIKESAFYDTIGFHAYFLLIPVAFTLLVAVTIFLRHNRKVKEKRAREVAESNRQLAMAEETILAIANTVDAKDTRTGRHSFRVARYSEMIARELGWSEEECANVRQAARVHDIGKIGISDAILNAGRKLTNREYRIMQEHTTRGAKILENFTTIKHAADGAKYHHERYDGKGYPSGLKGEAIPRYGRLIGVADAFDAMTASRVYRKEMMDVDYVLNELRRCSGTQFDPVMVNAFIRVIEKGILDVKKMYEENQAEQERLTRQEEEDRAAAEAEREADAREQAQREAAQTPPAPDQSGKEES